MFDLVGEEYMCKYQLVCFEIMRSFGQFDSDGVDYIGDSVFLQLVWVVVDIYAQAAGADEQYRVGVFEA